MLLIAERLGRQVYWHTPRLRAWMQQRRAVGKAAVQMADHEEFKDHLRAIGVCSGALVMAHTSVQELQFTEPGQPESLSRGPFAMAPLLLNDLLELLGPTGTLVMPSHPSYQAQEPKVDAQGQQLVIRYDSRKTPCNVGLANELFRRREGTLRSLHPWNTLAARGPLAAELLRDNLNGRKPLPHGVDSGYYRFCRRNGLAISVGVPLGRYLTLVHVAEDVRDHDWPIPNFFMERQFLVCHNGEERLWTVRQNRPEYMKYCLCMRKLCRDLAAEGILHEGTVGGIRVDWANSGEVFDYMMSRNKRSPYPYYWPWLIRKPK